MLRSRLMLVLIELRRLLFLLYQSGIGLRYWWLRSRGRGTEVDAMIERRVTTGSRYLLAKLHCEVRTEGEEYIPRDQAYVIFVNHQSKYDVPVLVGCLDQALGFVAKKELFRIPGMSFWMRQINCLPLDRSDIAGAAAALALQGMQLRDKRRGFIIFPEGTRSKDRDGKIQAFHRGSLRLACEYGLPILPVSIDGTRLLDRPDSMWHTRGGGRLVRLKIAQLRAAPGTSAPERKKFMDELHRTIVSNWEAIRVEWPQAQARR